jgi:hypothetical protein
MHDIQGGDKEIGYADEDKIVIVQKFAGIPDKNGNVTGDINTKQLR